MHLVYSLERVHSLVHQLEQGHNQLRQSDNQLQVALTGYHSAVTTMHSKRALLHSQVHSIERVSAVHEQASISKPFNSSLHSTPLPARTQHEENLGSNMKLSTTLSKEDGMGSSNLNSISVVHEADRRWNSLYISIASQWE